MKAADLFQKMTILTWWISHRLFGQVYFLRLDSLCALRYSPGESSHTGSKAALKLGNAKEGGGIKRSLAEQS